jgi:hypothetical protein
VGVADESIQNAHGRVTPHRLGRESAANRYPRVIPPAPGCPAVGAQFEMMIVGSVLCLSATSSKELVACLRSELASPEVIQDQGQRG